VCRGAWARITVDKLEACHSKLWEASGSADIYSTGAAAAELAAEGPADVFTAAELRGELERLRSEIAVQAGDTVWARAGRLGGLGVSHCISICLWRFPMGAQGA
jgi:hypothetical protein